MFVVYFPPPGFGGDEEDLRDVDGAFSVTTEPFEHVLHVAVLTAEYRSCTFV